MLALWARRFLLLVTLGRPLSEPRSGPRASLRCGHGGHRGLPPTEEPWASQSRGPSLRPRLLGANTCEIHFQIHRAQGVSFTCGGCTTPSSPHPSPGSFALQARGRQAKGLGVRAGAVFRSGLGPGACPGVRLGTRVTEGGYVGVQRRDSRPAPNVGWDFFGDRTFQM